MSFDTNYIAVIDTETGWNNQVISIGVTIGNKDFDLIDELYCKLKHPYPGMFTDRINIDRGKKTIICDPNDLERITQKFLEHYLIKDVFAYNARFDKTHLPTLADKYNWYDIMKIAAYKQYNPLINEDDECCNTGKLKANYSVEDMFKRTNYQYDEEKHNAISDARDELLLMKLLNVPLETYKNAKI